MSEEPDDSDSELPEVDGELSAGSAPPVLLSNYSIARSETLTKFAPAFVQYQLEVENADKNRNNPMFKSDYADLAQILDTVRPVLAKNGIAIIQSITFQDGVVYVTTLLLHVSGEWISGTISAESKNNTVQMVGACATYLRRYGGAGLCGIAQQDDDGNAASGKESKKPAQPDQSVADWLKEIQSLDSMTAWNELAVRLKKENKSVALSVSGKFMDKKVELEKLAKERDNG